MRIVLASVMMVAGWVLLAHLAARWMARNVLSGKVGYGEASEYLRMQMETIRWFAIPIAILCHYGFSLAAWLRIQPVLEHSMGLQAIGLLAPGITILVATWSAEYCFAAIIGIQDRSLKNYLVAMSRLLRSGPAWLVLPTLAFLCLGDAFEIVQAHYIDTPLFALAESSGWMWGLIGLGAGLIAISLPWFVRWIAKTQPLGEQHRLEMETWLHRCGISTHQVWGMQIARWDTGGRMLNAMVAGLVRPGRLLLVSDRLLDELPRGGRLMVVMHELAHVRRFHVPLRMAAILPAWFVSSWSSVMLTDHEILDASWSNGVGGVLGLITTVVMLGVVSHFSELDADATACRLAVKAVRNGGKNVDCEGENRDAEITLELAAELLADALTRVTADHPSSRKFSWLHPSLATRVARLRRISNPLPDSRSDRHTLAI